MSKSCAICEESDGLHTHHINGNEHDNRDENLIDLCPIHHGAVHGDALNELKDERVLELKERLPEKEAKPVDCHNCGYSWETESVRDKVTCPSCARKTEVNTHD